MFGEIVYVAFGLCLLVYAIGRIRKTRAQRRGESRRAGPGEKRPG